MSLQFNPRPSLMLESVTLVDAYVNHIPCSKLSRPGATCIPEAEIQRMTHEACRTINPQDARVQFFFQNLPLGPSKAPETTSLAKLLAFTFTELKNQTITDSVASIVHAWSEVNEAKHVFTDVYTHYLDSRRLEEGESAPFAFGLGKLPVPPALKERLLEAFSDFVPLAKELGTILQPVADVLQDALEPWVQRAKPLAQRLERELQAEPLNDFIRHHLHAVVPEPVMKAEAALVYLMPRDAMCVFSPSPGGHGSLRLLMGIGSSIFAPQNAEMANWEYQALRVLGNPERALGILDALKSGPMTAQEVLNATGFEVHLSTMTRDMQSMQVAHLLNLDFQGSRRRYSVNYHAIQTLARHLLDRYPPEEAEQPVPSDEI